MLKFYFSEDVKIPKSYMEKFTVVVPTYNEEKTIAEMLSLVKKVAKNVIVIGSKKCTDRTPEIVKKMGIPYVIDNGFGKGEALRLGIRICKTPYVVFIDADGSHDPKDIPRLVKHIVESGDDMVIGSRMMGGSDELSGNFDQFARLMFSNIITLIINSRFRAHVTDYQNGLRAIKVDSARDWGLKENITTIEQEMGMKCLKHGGKISEIATHEYDGGKSSFSVWKVSYKYFWQVFRDFF